MGWDEDKGQWGWQKQREVKEKLGTVRREGNGEVVMVVKGKGMWKMRGEGGNEVEEERREKMGRN